MKATYLTVAEMADLPKLNKQAVCNWINARERPPVKVGVAAALDRGGHSDLIEGRWALAQAAEGSPPTRWSPRPTAGPCPSRPTI